MNKKSLSISAILIILCVLWLASGLFSSDKGQAKTDDVSANENAVADFSVQVVDSVADNFIPDIAITGQSKASRLVDLRAEVAGMVRAIPREKGQLVSQGDMIIELNTDDRRANVKQAQERVRQREIEYRAAVNLENKGFSPRVRTAEMRAELEVAKANLESARLQLEDVNIRAPFEGIIDRQYIEVGDFVSIGESLVRLVDLDPLEFEVFASERDVQNIEVGSPAAITLNNETISGKVSFVAVSADPDTRTFPIEVEIPNEGLRFKEGLTAKVEFPGKQVIAHELLSSAIVLNTEGDIGIRAVDENNRVVFYKVEIVQSDAGSVWATGLPENLTVIIRGQNYVSDGDKVIPNKYNPLEDSLETQDLSDDQSAN